MARLAFEATKTERDNVAAMTAYGVSQDAIVQLIRRPAGKAKELKPISVRTLRKYFRTELDTGLAKATGTVADALYKRAIDLKHPQGAISGMFWLKCRAGWTEARAPVEHTGKGGGPIAFEFDLSGLSSEELAVYEKLLTRKALAAGSKPANDAEAA